MKLHFITEKGVELLTQPTICDLNPSMRREIIFQLIDHFLCQLYTWPPITKVAMNSVPEFIRV